jgi:hypothetical protein
MLYRNVERFTETLNDLQKRWTVYRNVERFTEPLQHFNLFDQPSDKSTDLQKRYNDSVNRYTFHESLNALWSII